MNLQPTFKDIQQAHERIRGFVHCTPVMTSKSINEILDVELYFKCENLQKVGAFKFRGACNSVFSLSNSEAKNGVCTHSSGNHAAALALAARMRGIPAYIVMPENAPEIKKKAVAGYGAQITFCEPNQAARESALKSLAQQTGATEIHPYNYFNVICGQGTAAKELIEEIGQLDAVIVPVGGGGLLSGTAITTRTLLPGAGVIAAEPAGAADAFHSFYSKTLHPSVSPQTIADGLLTSLGTLTFPIVLENVDQIVTVSESNIVAAMRMVWERMKIIIEPSSAVPLAAILEDKLELKGKKIGIILSGGNVDLEKLPF